MDERVQQTWQVHDIRFQALVEGSIQGILIHRNFTPLYANQALATLFGYASPEAILQLPTTLHLFAPRERVRLQQYNASRLQGESAPTHYEVQGIGLDGAIIWLENIATVVEWDGAPAVKAALVDITARKRAETALETRVSRLRTLTRLNQLVSSGLDLDGVLHEIAQAAATLTGAVVAGCWIADDTTGTLEARTFSDERLRNNFPGTCTKFGQGGVGWVAAHLCPLNVPDVFADTRVAFLDWWRAHGLRSFFALPVLFEGTLLGVLALNGRHPFQFQPEDQELLDSFVAQAAVTLRNARLYGEALEQSARLQALTRTSAKIVSTLQVDDLLHGIAEETAHLLQVEGAGFRLLDGDHLVVGGLYGVAHHVVRRQILRVGESLTGWVAREERPLAIPDMRVDLLPLAEHREAALKYGVAGYLGVPLRYRDRLIGVLNVYSCQQRLFQEHDVRLLGAFADQAAVAIEHVRVLEDARAQAAELARANTALQREIAERARMGALLAGQKRVLEMIATDVPLPDVLSELIRMIEAQSPDMLGSILLLSEDGMHLRHGAAPSLPEDYNRAIDGVAIGPSVGSCGTAVYRQESVIVTDIAHDPLWTDFRHLALQVGLRACWSTPILATNGTVLGTFAIYYRAPRNPSPADQHLIDLSTRLASLAIERQLAHEALHDSEARYRELFENANDIVCTLDLAGTFTSINKVAERITGYTRDDACQMSLVQIVAPEHRERICQMFAGEPASSPLTAHELEILTKTGTRVALEVSARFIYHNHTPVGIQAIARDVTGRKRLEEQLRQSQKMQAIGTLAGGIAHDFNNILAAMLGYAELALYDVPQASLVAHNLQEVITAGERAKSLVQQILTFSRQGDAERRPLQLHLLVQEALKLLRASLPTTITIRQHLTTSSDTVLADATQMQQVLMNLCSNAEHAMRSGGGELEVGLEAVEVEAAFAAAHPPLHPGAHVCLTVRDTGHGMAPTVLERIFEPFFTTKGVGEGTGMGLAIVHGSITNHGGAITVESVDGQGTTFAIYLPRLFDTVADSEPPAEPPLPRGTECIMFVDDEASLVHLGQRQLERLGYRVVGRTSSVEALEAFRTAPDSFDLVITDQTMPALTGEALIHELRRVRPDIPVILCTGFSPAMTEDKAHALGIDAFLMKPLLARDLALTVRQVLSCQVLSQCLVQ